MYRKSKLHFLDLEPTACPFGMNMNMNMLLPKSCILVRHRSSGGKRPKMKIYRRVHHLDRAMDLAKKPALILELKAIIQSQKHQSLLLRDLEKHVGFVQKWNFMSLIQKHPSIFYVGGGSGSPPFVSLTHKAQKIAGQEAEARMLMEPLLVKSLRKLLMLSVDCCLPLEKIDLIGPQLGLPRDFKDSLIPKYPEFFSVTSINGKDSLQLQHWDSSLAITARDQRLDSQGVLNSRRGRNKVCISKDGNYSGPFAFTLNFPAGFRPNMGYLKEVERWQKMEFPSPYLNARRFEANDPKIRKCVVAVLHELLSLTMEKRLTSAQLDAFHSEYFLPAKLVRCLIKHHGIFYITNKGARSTVFLKEAYDGSNLIDKCPLLEFNDRFIKISGCKGSSVCDKNNVMTSLYSKE